HARDIYTGSIRSLRIFTYRAQPQTEWGLIKNVPREWYQCEGDHDRSPRNQMFLGNLRRGARRQEECATEEAGDANHQNVDCRAGYHLVRFVANTRNSMD